MFRFVEDVDRGGIKQLSWLFYYFQHPLTLCGNPNENNWAADVFHAEVGPAAQKI